MATDSIPWRARAASLVVFAAIAALGAYTFAHLRVETDITRFIPSGEDQELAQVAREMTESDLNRSITILVSAEDPRVAIAASRDLTERLRDHPDVLWLRSGAGDDLNEAFYALFFERRLSFFTDDPARVAPRALSDEGLRASVRELKERLRSPTGTFVRQIAPRDPLLAFPHHLERMREAQQGGMTLSEGQFVTEDGQGVLFLASRASPFDSEASRRLLGAIDEATAAVRAEHGESVEVEMSSVHRFARASERAIRDDVTRISVFSTLGVVLLFVVVFRSFRLLVLAALPLVSGFVVGLAATHLAFGSIHGLSLAFGSTLIGIGIDYVAHAFNHHTLTPDKDGPFGSVKAIMPGLTLGAATTVAGLAGLAWTSFPGIRELAVITSVGVTVSLLTTRYLLPQWLSFAPRPTRLHRRVSRALGAAMERMRERRGALLVLPALALLVSLLGLSRIEWVDDIRALNTLDEKLVAEDERVRDAVSRMDAGRLVVAWGDDDEEALRRSDAVHRRLTAAVEAGELESFRSIHALLRSAETQRASFEALSGANDLAPRLSSILEAEGFVASGFAPFAEDLEGPPPAPLTWDELAASPVGALVSSFRVELEGANGQRRIAFIALTRGADLDALEARLAGLEGVRLFDQERFLSGAYGGFRARTLEMMALGLVAVFLLVLARYRRLRLALAAFLPAVLAAATALAVVALAGYQANLLHLTALLLVLSMGVDYGVFMVESQRHAEGPAATVTSMLIACTTTMLAFGLLAMSDNPALRALGLVSAVGVGLSLLLAPTAWLLLAQEPKGAK